jgi:hypothetical protein
MRAAITVVLSIAALAAAAGCTRQGATSIPTAAPAADRADESRPRAKVLAEIDELKTRRSSESDKREPVAADDGWKQSAEMEREELERRLRQSEQERASQKQSSRVELEERLRAELAKRDRDGDGVDDDVDDLTGEGKLGGKDKRRKLKIKIGGTTVCHPRDPLCGLDQKPSDEGGRAAARVAADDKPPDGVLREVRRHYPRMEACVPRTMRDRQRALSVELMLDGYGSFRDVRVQGGDLDQGTAACIEDVFFAMHIADADVQRVVTLPLWIRAAQ